MLSLDRANAVNPLVEELSRVDGIKTCERDDFNSTHIDIVIHLQVSARPPLYFVKSWRSVKSKIRSILSAHSVDYVFLDYPTPQYQYIPVGFRCGGPSKEPNGYDTDRVIVEVRI
jgi:hypothetical protein